MKPTKPVRCAIYTRVSTNQGLEQDFNSLDAQYDASQAYIRSQAHAGWTLLRGKHDDGGFSGGNTERPALQRLLEDVRGGDRCDRRLQGTSAYPRITRLFHRGSHNRMRLCCAAGYICLVFGVTAVHQIS